MGLLIKLFIGIILTAISYMAIPLIALCSLNGIHYVQLQQ